MVDKPGTGGFDADDEKTATAVASQLAVAWENGTLKEELHRLRK
jgi:GAF domain-containing protein